MTSQTGNPAVPITYARGNIIFGGGEAAAVYRLPTFTYEKMPNAVKWGLCDALGNLATGAEADISIHRVQRHWSAEDYVADAETMLDARFQLDPGAWTRYLEGHVPRLEGLNSYRPEVYLRVSQPKPKVTRGLRGTIDAVYRRATTAMAIGPDVPVMEREIEQRIDQNASTLARIREILPGARPITIAELQWLCLRAPVRHVVEPCLDQWWEPNALVFTNEQDQLCFQPCESDWLRLFNAPITRHRDHVVVDGVGPNGEPVRTLQAFLTLGALPFTVRFPGDGAELMFAPLDGLPFPVDAVFHGKLIPNQKALSDVGKAIVDAENRLKEQAAGDYTPDDLSLVAPEALQAIKADLTARDRPPLFLGGVSYVISVPEEAGLGELRERVARLRGRIPDIQLHRPPGLQERLYHDHLLNPLGGQITDYRERMSKANVGMLMPIAGDEIGSARGPYIGYTICGRGGRIGQPVKLDFLEAAANDETPSVLMVGRTGSGKTLTAQLAALLAALRGSFVFTADPSPDHHLAQIPAIADDAQTIGLVGADAYRGMLDPLVVTPEEMREEIALSYYLDVLPESTSRGVWETELTDATRAVLRAGRGGSLAVIEHLRGGNQDAQDVARALGLIAEAGVGILGFGDGTSVRGIDDVKRVTTVTMGHLKLPSKDTPRSAYSRRERLAVATFKLVGAYLMWLVKRADRTVHKVVVLDEAWTWTDTADGRHMLNELLRVGRKFNCTVIVLSQGVEDLGDLLRHFRYFFLFGVNELDEARRGLAMLGCDPRDNALAGRVASQNDFEKGRCLHRDGEGRVAEVQIDVVYHDVLEILKTGPGAHHHTAPPDQGAQDEVAAWAV